MKFTKNRVLAGATSIMVAASLLSTSLLSTSAAINTGDNIPGLGDITAYSESKLKGDIDYNKISYTDSGNRIQEAYTMQFNPANSEYAPLVYTPCAGWRYSVENSVQRATKAGYDVVGAVNGGLFDMSNGRITGMQITNGELSSGSNNAGGPAVIFGADGKATIGESKLSFKISVNGTEKKDGITSYLDSINQNSFSTNYMMYFDKFSGVAGDSFNVADSTESSTEIICVKDSGSTLKVAGKMTATVKSVEKNKSASHFNNDEFVLSTANTSPIINDVNTIKKGDKIEIEVKELNSVMIPAMKTVANALTGYHLLRQNGEDFSKYLSDSGERAPRTAIGVKADGTVVYFCSDGRNYAGHVGLTICEVSKAMEALGCTDALNLDGGGSTQLVTTSPDGTVNKPYTASARIVANTLMIAKKVAQPSVVPEPTFKNETVIDFNDSASYSITASGTIPVPSYTPNADGMNIVTGNVSTVTGTNRLKTKITKNIDLSKYDGLTFAVNVPATNTIPVIGVKLYAGSNVYASYLQTLRRGTAQQFIVKFSDFYVNGKQSQSMPTGALSKITDIELTSEAFNNLTTHNLDIFIGDINGYSVENVPTISTLPTTTTKPIEYTFEKFIDFSKSVPFDFWGDSSSTPTRVINTQVFAPDNGIEIHGQPSTTLRARIPKNFDLSQYEGIKFKVKPFSDNVVQELSIHLEAKGFNDSYVVKTVFDAGNSAEQIIEIPFVEFCVEGKTGYPVGGQMPIGALKSINIFEIDTMGKGVSHYVVSDFYGYKVKADEPTTTTATTTTATTTTAKPTDTVTTVTTTTTNLPIITTTTTSTTQKPTTTTSTTQKPTTTTSTTKKPTTTTSTTKKPTTTTSTTQRPATTTSATQKPTTTTSATLKPTTTTTTEAQISTTTQLETTTTSESPSVTTSAPSESDVHPSQPSTTGNEPSTTATPDEDNPHTGGSSAPIALSLLVGTAAAIILFTKKRK